MLTVAVIAQKGGVGKTTLALHLGVEAAKAGPVVIVDIGSTIEFRAMGGRPR